MICLMMYAQPNLSLHSEEVENLSLCKSLATLTGVDVCNVSDLTIVMSDFWHYAS